LKDKAKAVLLYRKLAREQAKIVPVVAVKMNATGAKKPKNA
jgi:hypothetical protein